MSRSGKELRYRANYGHLKVTTVALVSENPKSIWYINSLGRRNRHLKETLNWKYFKTFEEAKQHLIDRRLKVIEKARKTVELHEAELKMLERHQPQDIGF